MRIIILLFNFYILLLLFVGIIDAEEFSDESFVLKKDSSSYGTLIYKADNFIKLQKGSTDNFRYKTDGTNYFQAFISYSGLTSYPEDDCDYLTSSTKPNYFNRNIADDDFGTILGALNINSSGAATYQIPIKIPSGTNGMQPNISLVYSSQSGNGIAGFGWHLNGLSSISRIPKDLFYDDTVTCINYKNFDNMTIWPKRDNLAIDGKRMVSVQYSPAIYSTIEGNSLRIYAQGPNGSEYKSFIVEDRNGNIMEYGKTENSRLITNNGVLSWMISSITDPNGNYISFKYGKGINEIFISEIAYTGNKNSGLLPYCSIKFDYVKRSDANTYFNNKDSVRATVLLKSISVFYGSQMIRKYQLDHILTEYSLLKDITEYCNEIIPGTDELYHYPSTIFVYVDETEADDINIEVTDVLPHGLTLEDEDYNFVFGDFNGDGIQDRILIERDWDDGQQKNFARWFLQFGQYFGNDQEYIQYINSNSEFDITWDINSDHFFLSRNQIVVADLNRDGHDDLIVPYYSGWMGDCFEEECSNRLDKFSQLNFRVYVWSQEQKNLVFEMEDELDFKRAYYYSGDGGTIDDDGPYNLFTYRNQSIIPGDFDGDGFIELMLATKQTCWEEIPDVKNCIGGLDYEYGRFFERAYKTKILYFDLINEQGNINYNSEWQKIWYSNDPNVKVYSFNAIDDHLTDLLTMSEYTEDEGIYKLINGTNLFLSKSVEFTGFNFNENFKYYFGDFNGDGGTDLLYRSTVSNKWYIHYWLGHNFSEGKSLSFLGNTDFEETNNDFKELFLGDFNGDGKTDILTYLRNDKYKNEKINKITNEIIEVSYNYSYQEMDGLEIYIYPNYYKNKYSYDNETNINYALYLSTGNNRFVNYNLDFLTTNRNNALVLESQNATSRDVVEGFLWDSYKTSTVFYQDAYCKDFNGDGNADIYNFKNNCMDSQILTLFNSNNKYHLKTIVNGLDNRTDIHYKPISKDSDVYDRYWEDDYEWPLQKLYNGIFVVEEVDKYFESIFTPHSEIFYFFENPILHKGGRGFLGFEKSIIESDGIKETKTMEYDENREKFRTLEKKVEINNVLIQKETYEYDEVILDVGRYIPYIKKSIVDNYEFNDHNEIQFRKVSEISSMDSWGNPLEVKSIMGYPQPICSTFTQNTFNHYGNFYQGNNWCNNLLDYQSTTQWSTYTNKSEIVTNVDYVYSANDFKINSIIENDGLVKACTTSFNYDQYGNAIYQNLSQSYDINLDNRNVSICYDSKGRFPVKYTDELNNSIFYSYHPYFGTLLSYVDINKKKTTYEYDKYGQIKTIIYPNGESISQNIDWGITSSINPDDNEPEGTIWTKEIIATNRPKEKYFFDRWSQNFLQEYETFSSNQQNIKKIRIQNDFLDDGRIDRTTYPYYYDSQPTKYIDYNYDNILRISEVIDDRPSPLTDYKSETIYGIRNVTKTTPDNKTIKYIFDGAGNVTDAITNESTDSEAKISYFYNHDGSISEIKTVGMDTPDALSIKFGYDEYGNQTYINDPDAGLILYEYNPYNELTKIQYYPIGSDPSNPIGLLSETEYEYDKAGRTIYEKKINYKNGTPDIKEINYNFVTRGQGLEQLKSITGPDNYSISIEYDDFGRAKKIIENIDNIDVINEIDYNNYGFPIKRHYPTGIIVDNHFDQMGILTQTKRYINENISKSIWKLSDIYENGGIKSVELADNAAMSTTYLYDDYDFLSDIITTNNIQNLHYVFDPQKGLLESRQDVKNGQIESFNYDDFYRLSDVTTNTSTVKTMSYFKDGSISSIPDIGTLNYNDNANESSEPYHALESVYTVLGSPISSTEQIITYNSFNSIESISEGNKFTKFYYGPDDQRIKVEHFNNYVLQYTKYYFGDNEYIYYNDGSLKEITYLPGGDGICAVIIKEKSLVGETENTYFLHFDHLGSLQSVTDDLGNPIEGAEFSFDAWGRLRDANDWNSYYLSEDDHPFFSVLNRGFTGHEHMQDYALINMNGRVYDQALGRFLQPDNNIQMPDNPQNFNRFSYCLNNPVNFTDPSGEFIDIWTALFLTNQVVDIAQTYNNHGGDAALDHAINTVAMDIASFGVAYGTNSLLDGALQDYNISPEYISFASSMLTPVIMSALTNSKYDISTFGSSLAMSLAFLSIQSSKLNQDIANYQETIEGLKHYIMNEVVVYAKRPPSTTATRSSYNMLANFFSHLYEGSKVVPVWGPCAIAGECWARGDWQGKVEYFLWGAVAVADVVSLGASSKYAVSMKMPLTKGSNTIIESAKFDDHHLFPKEFKQFFKSKGINIEDYKLKLDRNKHRFKPYGIHTIQGGHWNKVWKEWIKNNPNANIEEIKKQMFLMKSNFGI